MPTKISILIGAFNAADFIGECLESIRAQSYFVVHPNDYEVLVGVDGCVPTLRVLLPLRELYQNMRLFFFPVNQGIYITRNTLLAQATGDFILTFDADDVMHPDMISNCINVGPCIVHQDGVAFLPRNAFSSLGGWMPWRCAGDTELLNRYKKLFGALPSIPQFFTYRQHDGQLTRQPETNFDSELRNNYTALINSNVIPDFVLPHCHTEIITTNFMTDKIHVGMASFPARQNSLAECVRSILPQIDHLYIYLNDYDSVPDFLIHDKITVYRSQDCAGDLGDVGKFWFMNTNPEGYLLTMDDDFVYSPNYVQTLISNIEQHQRKCIITFHGRSKISWPLKSFYHDPDSVYCRCIYGNNTKVRVQIGGTGVMGFHSSAFHITPAEFDYINMTDVFVSRKAALLGIPIIVPVHAKGTLKVAPSANLYVSIYESCHSSDELQTSLVNSYSDHFIKIQPNDY